MRTRSHFPVLLALLLFASSAGCGGKIAGEGPSTFDAPPPATTSQHVNAFNPFSPGDDWRGTYTCAQGLTNLDLEIVAVHDNVIDDAIFDFDWKSGGVSGSYHMTGTFDPETSNATFTPGAWIDNPGNAGGYGAWYTVGMSGRANAQTYGGGIDDSACGSFSVTKS